MKILIIILMSLLSFNAYGIKATRSPVTDFIEQNDVEGSFTIMQGKTNYKALTGRMENGNRDGEWIYYYPQSDQI